jgi:hypothetical protein
MLSKLKSLPGVRKSGLAPGTYPAGSMVLKFKRGIDAARVAQTRHDCL